MPSTAGFYHVPARARALASAPLVSHSGATVARLTAALQGLIANYRLQPVRAKQTAGKSGRKKKMFQGLMNHGATASNTAAGFHK